MHSQSYRIKGVRGWPSRPTVVSTRIQASTHSATPADHSLFPVFLGRPAVNHFASILHVIPNVLDDTDGIKLFAVEGNFRFIRALAHDLPPSCILSHSSPSCSSVMRGMMGAKPTVAGSAICRGVNADEFHDSTLSPRPMMRSTASLYSFSVAYLCMVLEP